MVFVICHLSLVICPLGKETGLMRQSWHFNQDLVKKPGFSSNYSNKRVGWAVPDREFSS